MSIDALLTKEIKVISPEENSEMNVSILSADAPVYGGHTATTSAREREHERENDKLCRVARDITVIPWQASERRPVERHWSNPNARRLIYAATLFRTATLKTLTAFNFRWPSILFSLVWTTFSRTRYPAPLRHAPHASAKEITCPLLPSHQICRLLSHPLSPNTVHLCDRTESLHRP